MIFNLYIYDRRGKCLFYKEWSRPLNTLADDPEEEKKLMFGMVYSLKELTSKISPTRGPEGLHTVKTKVQLDASPVFSPP
jgi:trafficking protein particle complex subunit 1